MRRPLRLTAAEATALLVALRALTNTPGVVDTDAVLRSLAKIESAVGQAQPAGVVVGLAMRETEATERTRQVVATAVRGRHALRIRYYTASRDEITDRTVDPMRLLLVEGRSYLEAWCRLAEDVRLFRLDRIDQVTELAEPAAPPPHARQHDMSEGLFRPEPDQREAVLVLLPDARWIAEYYPVEDLAELDGGAARVRMRYSDISWMVRLILAQAGDVLVEQPAELADAVMSHARKALARTDHLSAT
jgi:proteasome accessory factor C